MKSYSIKEIFLTLQGEGLRTGQLSVFVRFAGCNLWDGDPARRHLGKGACSKWCDTDFAHGTRMSVEEIVHAIQALWPQAVIGRPWVVITGGEPGLQVDSALMNGLHAAGLAVAIETNGTINVPGLLMADLLTVSPKRGSTLTVNPKTGEHVELKLVLPGDPDHPWDDVDARMMVRRLGEPRACYVQPQDPIDPTRLQTSYLHGVQRPPGEAEYQKNLKLCVEFIRRNPTFALSLQTHKYLDLP